MITVACVLVRGHVGFTPQYVANLAAMVHRSLSEPYRMVCLTDQPRAIPKGVMPIPVSTPRGYKAWWAKVGLFAPTLPITGRVIYLDLDTLIVDRLEPIVHFPAPFALIPHAGRFEGREDRAVVKRFNSSVMVWNAGEQYALHENWTKEVTKRLHGDQDWIGEQQPAAATMPLSWFPRLSEVTGPPFAPEAKVILSKKPKNVEAAKRWPWFAEAWRAA